MRINGREALACMTGVAEASRGGRPIRLEPLRNLPLVGDLLVDTRAVSIGIERVGLPMVRPADDPSAQREADPPPTQFVECIECGLCVSACPVAGTDGRFVGPAILAAVGGAAGAPEDVISQAALDQAHDEHGLWRCHAAFECSDVCPSGVDPGRRILVLRGAQMAGRGGGGQG
jgi:succinate dehydrogenase / fumarate reductase iron-sulfur subunit